MNTPLIRLSQAQLNLLELCPPQFQRVYLEQLASPISPEVQESLLWGNQFHQLMQQHFLGLSIDSILEVDQDLKNIVKALLNDVSQTHHLDSDCWREAEHYRALEKENYLLTAIYDLLILNNNQAQILDWKTYLKPQKKTKLENNWQTKLYLYLLAETSDYLPEQISLTYWFVKIPHQPQFLTFQYSEKLHKKYSEELESLLINLDNYLLNLNTNNVHFPHLKNCEHNCPHYELFFPAINEVENNSNLLSIMDEIEEVSI
ncbi:PD-(D/E)XK nuclease family protein [Crocosphaera sp.]|uniref:PD-(D/E)XK nuclease family protein n=1 Tax=Crocosphaera sp. TaxID=2729996 RepID=UPI003F21E7D4